MARKMPKDAYINQSVANALKQLPFHLWKRIWPKGNSTCFRMARRCFSVCCKYSQLLAFAVDGAVAEEADAEDPEEDSPAKVE